MAFNPDLLRPFLPPWQEAPGVTWWLGFSGGLDSSVLLHALWQLQLPIRLCALHINHGISPNAQDWQQHCAEVCARLSINFEAHNVQVNNQGKGIEDAARELRYEVFSQQLQAGDCFLTAHHADDQAETLLLRLMRGTGPRGLSAMAVHRSLGLGTLYRPLLTFSRRDLETYARECQLTWVDDESNSNDRYDRNFLRNQIMPLLYSRWPALTRKWQQTAELCAANEQLLEEVAADDLSGLGERAERVGRSLLLAGFNSLSGARQQNLLRYWLLGQGYPIPEQQHWQQIYRQLLTTRLDAQIDISWGGVSLRVYQQRLYCLPQQLPQSQLSMESGGSSVCGPRLKRDLPDLHIRYRQGGERCKPAGRAHSQTLKKLLQDYGLEPWLRDQVPLVCSGDEIVAVGDLWVCEGYAAAAEEEGLTLTWQWTDNTTGL